MGRWAYLDTDEERLPEGMKRVGYDSDTRQYTFRDSEGLWVGEPGDEWGGNLTYVGPGQEPHWSSGMNLLSYVSNSSA